MKGLLVLALALLLLGATQASAQKKPPAKEGPRILVAVPLGVEPGKTTKLTLRGLKLDESTGVRCLPKGSVKVLKKSKVGIPAQADPKKIGNTEVEVELTVPADVPGEQVALVADTPEGASEPHGVLLDRAPVVAEKEPNNGFKEAQSIALGQVVQGAVAGPQDVDVYRFEGKAGQKVVLDVVAARHGSALDSYLTLYDERGSVVDSSDDIAGSTDSRLEVTLPRSGVYYASVTDAHDQGGPTHVYRLSVRAK